jgi:cytochrome c553
MNRWKTLAALLLVVAILGAAYGFVLIRHGFSANAEPSSLEKVVTRTVRNISIPSRARDAKNPWKPTLTTLNEARADFADRCAICHGSDGSGQTQVGRNLYPKVPDLCSPQTQNLTDGQLHYIIRNGVRLTGMPAWSNPHDEPDDSGWKLVLVIRDFGQPTPHEATQQEQTAISARYVGSQKCEKCHEEIYAHWKKTPMANVVRDPREHADAIIPDLATNKIAKFTKDDVAFVYGSVWKQRYFTKIGDDYFPEPAQWDVTAKVWRPYFVAKGTDWWEPFYPPDNMKRPTGPTCDGCHSVDFNIHTKQVAEWNVGC